MELSSATLLTREGAMFHTESETIFAYNPLDGEATKVILKNSSNSKAQKSSAQESASYQLDQKLHSNEQDDSTSQKEWQAQRRREKERSMTEIKQTYSFKIIFNSKRIPCN